MNEHEALELFSPARERVMPPMRFSFEEVYAADARLRRRRTAAVSATVAIFVAIVGVFAFAGAGGGGSLRPAAPSTSTVTVGRPATLARTLASVPVPAGSVASSGTDAPPVSALVPGQDDVLSQHAFWTSPLSPAATLSWYKAHLATRWSSSVGWTSAGVSGQSYLGPTNPYEYGPNLDVSVKAVGATTIVRLDAWDVPLTPKSAAEQLHDVTAATVVMASVSSVRYTGAAAKRLAADVNALPVRWQTGRGECTQAGPEATVTFASSAGSRKFSVDGNCRIVSLVEPADAGPGLATSAAFIRDLQTLPSAAADNTANATAASKPVASAPNLVSIVDQLPVPSPATQISTPADGEAVDEAGYSDQPGYQQVNALLDHDADPCGGHRRDDRPPHLPA